MLTKETRRLFQGQYQYKAVLVCPAAGWFRGRNVSEALDKIKENGIGAHKNPFNKVKIPTKAQGIITANRLRFSLFSSIRYKSIKKMN